MSQLIDRFGRVHTYLRISVTDRCNLRCVYCMPSDGIEWKSRDEIMTFEEIFRVAQVFANLGINKIRFTGGEPLVRKDMELLIARLSGLNNIKTLAMTTNAVLLKDKALRLKKSGLKSINISLDTFREDRFAEISRRPSEYKNVMAGIDAAVAAGFPSLKLNTVVMANINDDEILDFVEFVKDKPINIRFIEYMPFKNNLWSKAGFLSYRDMKKTVEERYELKPLYGNTRGVAKDFYIEGFKGTVSFITAMSDSFCATCNRIRLTADGYIKSCLFHPAEVRILEPLRSGISDEELTSIIQGVVLLKPEAHPPMEELVKVDNRPMIQIGG